ncbi:hypothetical protein IscW_ISCW019167, partial [Ixodes scapularis]
AKFAGLVQEAAFGRQEPRAPLEEETQRVREEATMLEAITLDDYEFPTTRDVAAYRESRLNRDDEPDCIVFIGIAKWFDRVVAQRVFRHRQEGGSVGQLVAIDLVMFLLTEGYVLEHCSLEIYASRFPSFSELCSSDLLTQAQQFGRVFDKFVVRYASLRDGDSATDLVAALERSGVSVGPMGAEEWSYLSRLERDWTIP